MIEYNDRNMNIIFNIYLNCKFYYYNFTHPRMFYILFLYSWNFQALICIISWSILDNYIILIISVIYNSVVICNVICNNITRYIILVWWWYVFYSWLFIQSHVYIHKYGWNLWIAIFLFISKIVRNLLIYIFIWLLNYKLFRIMFLLIYIKVKFKLSYIMHNYLFKHYINYFILKFILKILQYFIVSNIKIIVI